ncbi:MAG: plastocyanin/azurin family copper-binding protein [Hyphomicrobiales bacterium]
MQVTVTSQRSGSDWYWSPSSVTVTPGSTVTWTWSGTHNVVVQGLLNSDIGADASASFTFGSAGTYAFYCALHPTTMAGTVIVQ